MYNHFLHIIKLMEEFAQILIFIGAMVIAVVSQYTKKKKKPVAGSPGEVLEEMFPEIDFSQETTDVEPQPKPIRRKVSTPKQTSLKQVSQPQAPPSPAPQSSNKIRLNTRQEARRAFIHSEIFNRKY